MSRVRAAALLVLLASLVAASPAAAAESGAATRAALSAAWDRAGVVASAERPRPGEGPILARTVGGIPALVVRADATLADLRRAAPADVRQVRRGVWELERSVWVVAGATLAIQAPEVSELRLVSRGRNFATVAAREANLRILGRRGRKLLIHSWQAGRDAPDRTLDDGRGSLSIRGAGRFDAFDVRFEDLGYTEGRLSGVAVTAPRHRVRSTGHFRRSDFVRNYFGAYTYEARNVVWVDDRFLDNMVYGLDPHDDSDGFVVKRNLAEGNGRHGIIFSRLCDDNVITGNVAIGNGWHGIVLDDGKLGDGPSNRNLVVHNTVRDNGKVGISIDGSDGNRISDNRVSGQPIGIRVFGRALGNVVERNEIRDAAEIGVFVDAPAQGNALVGNRVVHALDGVRIRGADETTVRSNALLALSGHGVSVREALRRPAPSIMLEQNTIAGQGRSPIQLARGGRVEASHNRVAWNYPRTHDAARVLGWVVGPAVWLGMLGTALLGPFAFAIGGASAQRRRLGVMAGAAAAVGAIVLALGAFGVGREGPAGPAATPLPRAPADPRVAPAQLIDRSAEPFATRVVSKEGHVSHPTWYHDSQAADLGDEIVVSWNARDDVRAARLRSSDLAVLDKSRLNDAPLGGATDSTGTDTHRHDVPTVITDAAGRAHFLYGGGSIAGRSRDDGPYHRATARAKDLASLSRERPLDIGGGAAFDFEAVTDATGVRHLFGQRGRGNSGSLIELRMARDGRWLAPRQVIAGGFRRDACVQDRRARGCNRFAIARVAADPRGWLHLVWGFSEASLGGKCSTDRGYCDNGLFYAVSRDRGATWRDASGRTAVRIGHGRSVQHDDARFRLASGHVGLFKALAAGLDGPLVVYSDVRRGRADLVAARLVGGGWRTSVVARSGDAGVRSWNGSLVVRRDAGGFTLWTPTGDRIFRFFSRAGDSWQRSLAYRGPAWSLTGLPIRASGRQLLLWRGARTGRRSEVLAGLLPAGG